MKTLISIGSIAVSALALNLIPVQQAQAVDLAFSDSAPTTTEALYTGVGYNNGPTISSKTFGNWTSEGYNFLLPNGSAIADPNTAVVEESNPALKSLNFYGSTFSAPVGDSYIAADSAYLQGRIYQDLTGLVEGDTYIVSYYQAAAQQTGYSGATTDTWTVNVGGTYTAPTYSNAGGDNYGTIASGGTFSGGTTHESPTMSLASKGNAGTQTASGAPAVNGWQQDSFTFTATSSTQTLSFLAKGTPNGKPPFALLGGVSANKIPEPDTYVGTLLGLGILGTVVKSRFAKKKLDE